MAESDIFSGTHTHSRLPVPQTIDLCLHTDSPPVMISLEHGNEEFQAILRRELDLSSSASFHSRDALFGTQLYEYCICIIRVVRKPVS